MKCKLGDYIRIKHGFAFKGEYITAENNGVVLVTPGNFEIGGGFKEDKCKFFNGDYPKEYVLSPYDLIVTMTDLSKQGDTLGYSALVPKTNRVYLHNQRIGLVDVYNPKADKMFIYWLMRTQKYQKTIVATSSGSTVKHTSPSRIYDVEVDLPPIDVQKKIAAILSALDEKIAINRAINDNLQQQAAALFESWFVNYDPWDGVQPSEWENAPLGSFVEIKRGGSPRPIQDFLSDSGLRWLKISDVTSLSSPFVLEIKEHIKEEGLRKTVFLHAGELVLSNSATPGIPKILDVDTCIHDGWLYFPKSELSKYYLYLFFKHIRKELVALGNGSVFTNLKTDILKAFPATKADESTLKEFDALVTPLFDAMLNADRENFKLAAMRDALLPKLMSSEIDVSEVEL